MEKSHYGPLQSLELPKPGLSAQGTHSRARAQNSQKLQFTLALCFLALFFVGAQSPRFQRSTSHVPIHASETLSKCRILNVKPSPPPDFNTRIRSDRFVPGTNPYFIRNATIWTGRLRGLEILKGDVLIAEGLIKAVGHVHETLLSSYDDLVTLDANGSWLTPGIVDLHSHIGVWSTPQLQGASNDANSVKSIINGWLKALDGLNTHDEGYKLAIAGGVTTSLILPGSADAMGGQGFVIKLRATNERSPTSLLVEPPLSLLNGSEYDHTLPPRWRHMKHACGENPSRVFSGTRMDTNWAWRQAYDKARQIKRTQDEYCEKALAGQWDGLGAFPEELQWEALVDVLRGKVKVQTHCYEAVDIDAFVRLSNEFEFEVAAFHHAHEAYLVPEVLKKAYGRPPAIAMFATFSRYKREAYRHSEFAPRLLADEGIKVVMKSDHVGIISRYLLHEAQQAHHYGLPYNIALSSVTSTPAEVMGLEHRLGFVRKGYDADIVLWDSHPLALGATPTQVFIDGVPQLGSPFTAYKPASQQKLPHTPNYDKEAAEAVLYEGLPPLSANATKGRVVFTNVATVWVRREHGAREVYSAQNINRGRLIAVMVENGRTVCQGLESECLQRLSWQERDDDVTVVDLEGGGLYPGLVSFGSQLGLQEIQEEASTQDGSVFDPLTQRVPRIIGGDEALVRAVDGLQYGTRDALLAYRSGVVSSITPPLSYGFLAGLSTAVSLGAAHKLQDGAVIQNVAAIHIAIRHYSGIPSISSQITTLRTLLLGHVAQELESTDARIWITRVRDGAIPLVIHVDSADIMATLLELKKEVEEVSGVPLKLTFTGATEAHLLAPEISAAGVGVIVTPPRSYPYTWESRRILPGIPLSQQSTVAYLLAHNITVGIGPQGVLGDSSMSDWAVRNLRFDAAWLALEAEGQMSKAQAIDIASTNIEKLLGVDVDPTETDLVATRGGDFLDFESKVVAVLSPRRGIVDLF